ncbi:efflux RND transporter periplasmic adaptor subunit [Comamonas sp. 26]|uniref:efflux RND transporter periplasmic adaptor subunit n=1 Tax=Comamonas sp. 26 TaxID=2035201 RepID=UPI000C18FDB6|nr:efflux RND transporter periplasmic adaptor subunit [Comamonas sp. 26]PIG09247.1 multidrug efflux system membrane fusion protein [Comamonas sp. 26]
MSNEIPVVAPGHSGNKPASTQCVPRKVWGLVGVAAALALVVAWPHWHGQSAASTGSAAAVKVGAAKVPVRTALVTTQDMPLAVTGIGTVLPAASVTIRTRVDGQLDQVAFKEGQDVKAGQVLAKLDARTFQAQLQQAQAQKAKDEALLTNAQTDLQRYNELIRDEATTRQTLETQKSLVRQLQATVQNDAALVHYAQVQLGFTTITSPIAGRVGARLVDAGNIVHAADTGGLLVVNQIDPIALQFSLPQEQFQAVNRAINTGQTLAVQAQDQSSRALLATGALTLVNNQIDTTTGTITLKAYFANPEHKLWPGQTALARLVLDMASQAVVVPNAAVQRGSNGLFAYVVDKDHRAQMQPLVAGDSDGELTVISQGLKPGQRVVTDGQYRLTPGAQVVDQVSSIGSTGSAADKGHAS